MLKNAIRITSYNVADLTSKGRQVMGFGKPATTLILKKIFEKKFGARFDDGFYNRSALWGKVMEYICGYELGDNYKHVANQTIYHPDPLLKDYWCGRPDFTFDNGACEVKCYQKANFVAYTECLFKQDLNIFKKEFPTEYWQIVSSVILSGSKYGEAVSFMPDRKMFEHAKYLIEETNFIEATLKDDAWKYRFILETEPYYLAVLPEKTAYNSLNRFRFEVPYEDKEYLSDCVVKALLLSEYGPTFEKDANVELIHEFLNKIDYKF